MSMSKKVKLKQDESVWMVCTSKDEYGNGEYTYQDADGTTLGIEHRKIDGELDGVQTWFHENGNKESEHHFTDGKADGKWTWWYENGNLQEERFHTDGFQDGRHTYYDEDGEMEFHYIYKDGKLVQKLVEDFQILSN